MSISSPAFLTCPIVESSGRVKALLYGDRLLNFNYELVDKLRGTVFSETEFKQRKKYQLVTVDSFASRQKICNEWGLFLLYAVSITR